MSATIQWQPNPEQWRTIPCGSHHYKALCRVFGEFPFTLTRDALPQLRAMDAVDASGTFSRLARAIEENESIYVRAGA